MKYVCTSWSCLGPEGKLEHCPDCSHMLVYDSVVVDGKTYKFEFAPRWGYQIQGDDGEYNCCVPDDGNVWEALNTWQYTKLARCFKRRLAQHKAKMAARDAQDSISN